MCCDSHLSLVQFSFSFVLYGLSYINKHKNKGEWILNQGYNGTTIYTQR